VFSLGPPAAGGSAAEGAGEEEGTASERGASDGGRCCDVMLVLVPPQPITAQLSPRLPPSPTSAAATAAAAAAETPRPAYLRLRLRRGGGGSGGGGGAPSVLHTPGLAEAKAVAARMLRWMDHFEWAGPTLGEAVGRALAPGVGGNAHYFGLPSQPSPAGGAGAGGEGDGAKPPSPFSPPPNRRSVLHTLMHRLTGVGEPDSPK
jgi:hypothetical protein